MVFKVNPWEVSGDIDYEKLIEEFGTFKINEDVLDRIRKNTNELHPFLERGFFFSHRGLDSILESYENGEGFFLYTGRKPSGDLHIGHLVPFMFTQWLQDRFNVNVYIQITDDEAIVTKRDLKVNDIDKFSKENILDIISIGFNPDKTFVFRNLDYPQIYEPAVKVAKNTTFSTVKSVFGFKNETNIGFVFYPAIQAAPCFFENKPCLIPSAIDQDPYWRIQRDVATKLGYPKTSAIHSRFLPSLRGPSGKMSASDPSSAIYLKDNEDIIKEKINRGAFTGGKSTLGEQKMKGGNPDICSVYAWLHILFEEDNKKIEQIYMECRNGERVCGDCKAHLQNKVGTFLKKHHEKKKQVEKKVDMFTNDGKLARQKREGFYK